MGINTYSVDRLATRPIRYAVSDVEILAKLLREAAWETIVLTAKGTVNQATRRNIMEALDKTLAGTGPNDLVLILLSGHGRQFRARIDRSEGAMEQEEFFFCPSDGNEKKIETLIGITELLEKLDKAQGRKLMLVDAARIAPPGVAEPNASAFRVPFPPNTAILFGSATGQHALETTLMYGKEATKGHGIFTYRVIKALEGAAINAKGEVTWNSLAEYVKEHVNADALLWYPEHARKTPSGEKIIQTPHLIGSIVGSSPVLASIKK